MFPAARLPTQRGTEKEDKRGKTLSSLRFLYQAPFWGAAVPSETLKLGPPGGAGPNVPSFDLSDSERESRRDSAQGPDI